MNRAVLLSVLLLAPLPAAAEEVAIEATVTELRSGRARIALVGGAGGRASIEPGDRVEFSTTMDGLRVAAGSGVVSEVGEGFVWVKEVDSRVTLGMTARIHSRTEPAPDLVSEAAEAPAAPSDEDVLSRLLRRHHEAMGGEAWDDVETLRVSGEMTLGAYTQPFRQTWKRPESYRIATFATESDLSRHDARSIMSFTDGKGWWVTGRPAGGWQHKMVELFLKPVPQTRLKEFSIDPWYWLENPFSHWRSMGFEIAFEGREQVQGAPAYRVRVQGNDMELSYFIDAETFRLRQIQTRSDTERRLRLYGDYQPADGLMIARSISDSVWRQPSQSPMEERVWKIRRVEVNVEVDDSLFQRP